MSMLSIAVSLIGLVLTANIFDADINKQKITKQGRLAGNYLDTCSLQH